MQTKRLTRAEQTDYKETSTFADVVMFCDHLAKQHSFVKVHTLCKSSEGRIVPLLVISKAGFASGSEAHAQSDGLVVYVQANIHAGEVEGKEAILMLVRDLLILDQQNLLDHLTLVVAPIYNADGNEKWGDGRVNRAHQDGPERVGERSNGQGLDLNRDCVKAESPEFRGVLKEVYGVWDPDVVFDLHTTNGTRHGYQLTYGPATHPDTDPAVLQYQRDDLLPAIRKQLRRERAWELFDYGNTEPRGKETIWGTFGFETRYVTNYAGLRDRLGILSEAVSFLPFKFRVETTYVFVRKCFEKLVKDRQEIRTRIALAALRRPTELTVRAEMAARGVEVIPLEDATKGAKIDHSKAPTRWKSQKMPVYDRWATTAVAKVPKEYALDETAVEAIALLRRHGFELTRKTNVLDGYEGFSVTGTTTTGVFQGHDLRKMTGNWVPVPSVKGRFWILSTDQPLRTLLFNLLEPDATDTFWTWNVFDRQLAAKIPFILFRKL